MNLFGKRKPKAPQPPAPPQTTAAMAGLPRQGDALPAALKAHSQFVKRVNCSQCGGPKTLPSATAYLYCDYCGALMDYDFRIANADTNAGVTNTVFHRIMAGVQAPLAMFKGRGDRESYRQLYRQVYAQWAQECPLAISPRAKTDAAFREQFINYQVECAVAKEFDPRQAPIEAQMAAAAAGLQRVPQPGGAWRVTPASFWPYAQLFKQQMDMTYALLKETGVLAMDPDQAPAGVPLQMEYSLFCQAWLPHLTAAEGDQLLAYYGLAAEYDQVQAVPTVLHRCGGCGSEVHTLMGARQVVCDACGRKLDIGGGAVPCRKCGNQLSFPVGVSQVNCPYCQTPNKRV